VRAKEKRLVKRMGFRVTFCEVKLVILEVERCGGRT
jgi:hypothetical protein